MAAYTQNYSIFQPTRWSGTNSRSLSCNMRATLEKTKCSLIGVCNIQNQFLTIKSLDLTVLARDSPKKNLSES